MTQLHSLLSVSSLRRKGSPRWALWSPRNAERQANKNMLSAFQVEKNEHVWKKYQFKSSLSTDDNDVETV
jgi:hypothetical protein